MNMRGEVAPSTHGPAEQAARDRVVERLADKFPQLPKADITHRVHDEYRKYAQSPIRDFIPILVERSVKSELAGPTGRHRG